MNGVKKGSLGEVSCVLFDLDGTLADTTELIVFSFRETLHRLGLPPRSDERILAEIGRPLRQQTRDIDTERADEIFDLYGRIYDESHDKLVREFPGVREALAGLAGRGYRLGLVTSKRSRVTQADLVYFRIDVFFEVVVTADMTARHKPEPEPVLEALRLLDAAPRQAAFIGDSPYDLCSAHAAGVLAGAVAWGPFPREVLQAENPDFWVEDLSSLSSLFPGRGDRRR